MPVTSIDELESLKARIRGRVEWKRAVETARRLAATTRARWPHGAPKFLNLDFWLERNIRRAAKLGLLCPAGRKVLDLGSGTGLFLFVCKTLGHEATGIDLPPEMLESPEREIFTGMPDAFGVSVIRKSVCALQPLDIDGQFDLIVSFMVCFNNHKLPDEWSRPEWEYFVSDMCSHLRPNGRLALRLNHHEEKFGPRGYLDRETRDFFERAGSFDDGRILIAPGQSPPSPATS